MYACGRPNVWQVVVEADEVAAKQAAAKAVVKASGGGSSQNAKKQKQTRVTLPKATLDVFVARYRDAVENVLRFKVGPATNVSE